MVLAESKNGTNGKHRGNGAGRGGRGTGLGQSEMLYTTVKHEADRYWMRSITQQNGLDGFFLNTAELADTDFTAGKMGNLKITHKDQIKTYLLTADGEKAAKTKHRQAKQELTRRGFAELQKAKDLLITLFERNLEVWRQLWRVIERSDLVVQIVDARNLLMFRYEDLERDVKEVDERRTNLLLVNKADLMTAEQRSAWAVYLEKEGINYRFFSVVLEKQTNEECYSRGQEKEPVEEEGVEEEKEELRIRILTVDELEEGYLEHAPIVNDPESPRRTQIGLVSGSSTPGKTKHFQALHLCEKIALCDCPGLVFSNFATTNAELVCNGVLPIDQLREFRGPTTLAAQPIPQQFFEYLYGINIHTRPFEEGGTGVPTEEELLMAYPRVRGFQKTGAANPDKSRAARYVLKDYVSGKLLFFHPPPSDSPIYPFNFSKDLYNESHDLDRKFFAEGRGGPGHMKTPFHLGAGAAGALPRRKEKATGGKKSFKGRKNIK
ncbi:hypothetical protein C7212DRAFT_357024 [Tuber magnatum]|uniref:P-loop containing nucleoside triphosphate hydrolase protein n=1 Tax=Tuber magnatum TaxID=42249 RepID=A0A317SRU4_9PEZI|nr:hypothetical protein C7212DRAFT_357024 [Tuber magnatum]